MAISAPRNHMKSFKHKKFRQLCRSTSQKQSPPSCSFLRWGGGGGALRSLSFIQISPPFRAQHKVSSTSGRFRFPQEFPKISSNRNLSEEKSVEKSRSKSKEKYCFFLFFHHFFSPLRRCSSLSLSRTLAQASKRERASAKPTTNTPHLPPWNTHTHAHTLSCGRVVNFFFFLLLFCFLLRNVPFRIPNHPVGNLPHAHTHTLAHERTTHTGSVRRFLAQNQLQISPRNVRNSRLQKRFSVLTAAAAAHTHSLSVLFCFFFSSFVVVVVCCWGPRALTPQHTTALWPTLAGADTGTRPNVGRRNRRGLSRSLSLSLRNGTVSLLGQLQERSAEWERGERRGECEDV